MVNCVADFCESIKGSVKLDAGITFHRYYFDALTLSNKNFMKKFTNFGWPVFFRILAAQEPVPEVDVIIPCLSNFKEQVVTYIAGYVVKMVKRKVNCPEYLASLTFDSVNDTLPHSFCLLNRKKMGLFN